MVVRIEPYNDEICQSFRRDSADRLRLLDREEQPIYTRHELTLVRDAAGTEMLCPQQWVQASQGRQGVHEPTRRWG